MRPVRRKCAHDDKHAVRNLIESFAENKPTPPLPRRSPRRTGTCNHVTDYIPHDRVSICKMRRLNAEFQQNWTINHGMKN